MQFKKISIAVSSCVAIIATSCNTSVAQQENSNAPEPPLFQTTNPIVHDPVVAFEDGTYYLFATGNGITQMTSTDLKSWQMQPPVLQELPQWVFDELPQANMHLWAPDIFYANNQWHLFYCSSAFAKNTSVIGHLTSPTLNNAKWKDEGMIVRSVPNRDMWNAIDPNIIQDDDGRYWMTFGSFWDGIMLVELKSDLSGIKHPQEWHRIAHRHRTETLKTEDPGDGAIEAPFIYKANGFYYLFVSFDYCCRGAESTYKVVVGRSENVTGPYVDKDGVLLGHGGGTTILEGKDGNWAGVGHCSVYKVKGKDMLFAHAYDMNDGTPHLVHFEINWNNEWPEIVK